MRIIYFCVLVTILLFVVILKLIMPANPRASPEHNLAETVSPSEQSAGNLEEEYNKGEIKFPKPEKNDPLKIFIKKNNVKIIWNVKFTGKSAGKKAYGKKATYRRIIKKAIISKWSGKYKVKGHKIKVTVKITQSSKRERGIIYFYKKKGIPAGLWNSGGYYSYIKMYTGDSRNKKSFSYEKFRRAAAHEFGHVIGIGLDGPVKKNSIMCDPLGYYNGTGQAVNKDIRKVLTAYKNDCTQDW